MPSNPPEPKNRQSAPPGWVIPLGLVGIVLLAYLRVFWRLGTHVPLPRSGFVHPDTAGHVWQYGWLREAASSGDWSLITSNFSFPYEISLVSLWEGHLDLLAAFPLLPLVGDTALFNLTGMLHLLLGAAGSYALAKLLMGSRRWALTAALLYACCPFVLAELSQGRTEAATVGLHGAVLALMAGFLARGGVARLAGALAILAFAVFAYLPGAVMFAFLFTTLLLAMLPTGRAGPIGRLVADVGAMRTLGRLLAVAVGLAAVAGASLLLVREDMILPSYESWLVVSSGRCPPPQWLVMPEGYTTPSLLLPLASAAFLHPRKRLVGALWLCIAVLLFLSLGPRIGPYESPYAELGQLIPGMTRFHWPIRLTAPAYVIAIPLAALGLREITHRAARLPGRAGPTLRWALPAGLVLAAAAQTVPGLPLPAGPLEPVPAIYQQLAQHEPTGVLEVNAGHRRERAAEAVSITRYLAQTVHGAPMCCLPLPDAMLDLKTRSWRNGNRAFAWLIRGRPTPPDADQLRGLTRHGFSHLVLHGFGERAEQGKKPSTVPPPFLPMESAQRLLREAYGEPVLRQTIGIDFIEVYRMQAEPEGS